jgi:hypothetical protein
VCVIGRILPGNGGAFPPDQLKGWNGGLVGTERRK